MGMVRLGHMQNLITAFEGIGTNGGQSQAATYLNGRQSIS